MEQKVNRLTTKDIKNEMFRFFNLEKGIPFTFLSILRNPYPTINKYLKEDWDMSYEEHANNEKKLTKSQIKEIQKGTVFDWLHDTHKLTPRVYESAKKGAKLSYNYSYEFMPVVRE